MAADGLTRGVRLLGMSTSTVLSLSAAAGVALATSILARVPGWPRPARYTATALGTYGAAAFVHGVWTGTPFPVLLAGGGLWRILPYILQGAIVGGLVVLPAALLVSVIQSGLRAPRPGSRGASIRRAAALAAVLALVAAALPFRSSDAAAHASGTPAAASPPDRLSAEQLAALDNSFRAIEDSLRDAPRDRWDPAYVVQQVGRDPQLLFEWVRDNTSWIPYRGILRGAAGVLNDRLGNSLDRAVLLATLLKSAGHTVRLAHRQLGEDAGIGLLTAAIQGSVPAEAPPIVPVAPPPPAWTVQATAARYHLDGEAIARTIDARTQTLRRVMADLDRRVDTQTRRLLDMVGGAPGAHDWYARVTGALPAVRDHWWVQRHESGTWVDLDVLHNDASAGSPAVPDRVLTLEELGPLQHTLTVRVVEEQFSGGRGHEREVLAHVLRPAETIGQAILVQFWPSEAPLLAEPADGSDGFRATALAQRRWDVAVAVDGRVAAQARLAASGDAAPAARGGPMAMIGQRMSQRQSDAADAADGLTALWLEYEIRSPFENPRRIRREVFDLRGPAARGAGAPFTLTEPLRLSRNLALMTRTELLPINCALATEYVANLAGRSLVADRKILGMAARGELTSDTPETQALLNAAGPAFTSLYSFALIRLDWSRFADQIFIDRLNLVARHRFPASSNGTLVVRDAIDIVANEVGVELAQLDPFPIRVEQGVFDTNVERLLLTGAPAIADTADAFAESVDWTAVRGPAHVDAAGGSEDVRSRIASDLAAGYTVIAAPAAGRRATDPTAGWWRIDSASGDTLGMGPNGWGQSMSERGVQYNALSEIARRFAFDYAMCQAIPIVVNAVTPMVDDVFGRPGWVAPAARHRTTHELHEENFRGCILSAIKSGAAFATLPLLLATLRYAGRAALPLLRELLHDTRGSIRIPPWGPKTPGPPPRTPSQPPARIGSRPPRYDPGPVKGRVPKGSGPFQGDPEQRKWLQENWDPDPTKAHQLAKVLGSPKIYAAADSAAVKSYNEGIAQGLSDEGARAQSFDAWWKTVRAERAARGVYHFPVPGDRFPEWVPEPASSPTPPPGTGAATPSPMAQSGQSPLAQTGGGAPAAAPSGPPSGLGVGAAGVSNALWPPPRK